MNDFRWLRFALAATAEKYHSLRSVPIDGIRDAAFIFFTSATEQEVSMLRHELTDEEWAIMQPLLPTKVRGVPRVDDRLLEWEFPRFGGLL